MTTDNDFDPVEDLDGIMRALTQPQWGQTIEGIGQDLRIATKLLEKTKAELIRMIGEEYLRDNPNRFRRQPSMGLKRKKNIVLPEQPK